MGADILIKDGLIVDGTGAPAYRGNVAVKDGKIASVGNGTETADRVIDADGLAVAPGFWDMHTHYDAQLLWDPIATSTCWHGVTTVIMGNCGFTIAPCKPEDQEWMARMLARVEGMDIGVLKRTLPWPWESFGEYLDTLDKGIGLNALAQVGHSAVRRYVMGADASEREATAEEIEKMKAVIAESLDAGGTGLTTSRGFSHWDGDGRPVPSRAAALDEFMDLAAVLKGTKVGFIEMAAGSEFTHTRSEGRARLKRLAEISGRPVCWSAISATLDKPDAWEQRLADFNALRAEGVPLLRSGLHPARRLRVQLPLHQRLRPLPQVAEGADAGPRGEAARDARPGDPRCPPRGDEVRPAARSARPLGPHRPSEGRHPQVRAVQHDEGERHRRRSGQRPARHGLRHRARRGLGDADAAARLAEPGRERDSGGAQYPAYRGRIHRRRGAPHHRGQHRLLHAVARLLGAREAGDDAGARRAVDHRRPRRGVGDHRPWLPQGGPGRRYHHLRSADGEDQRPRVRPTTCLAARHGLCSTPRGSSTPWSTAGCS